MDKKYTVTDHNDGKKYDITEHIPDTKQEKSTDELIAQARKLFPRQEPKQEEPKQTKFDKQLEQSKKQWDLYFRQNPSKIPYKLPNLFDKNED